MGRGGVGWSVGLLAAPGRDTEIFTCNMFILKTNPSGQLNNIALSTPPDCLGPSLPSVWILSMNQKPSCSVNYCECTKLELFWG